MRFRSLTMILGATLLSLFGILAYTPASTSARLQESTPAAGTPTAEPAGTEVVTLVAWYQQDPSGDFLTIGPLSSNQFSVAAAGGTGLTGRADFDDPDNNDLPRITLGDSVFDGYALDPEDPTTVFRWTYFNNEDGGRPATLVIQITCSSSPAYKDYTGTATFISRASDSGGVLVIVLNPPAA